MDVIFYFVFLLIIIGSATADTCPHPVRLYAGSEVLYFESHNSYGTDNYPNNLDNCWLIEADEGEKIKLTSSDIDLYGDCSTGQGDNVNIHSGESDNGDLLDSVCGDYRSNLTLYSGRYMYVEFITDDSGRGEGFKMAYSSYVSDDTAYHSIEKNSAAGFIAAIVIGCLFGLGIIIGITACIITCIVIAWNEKKTATVAGVVHSTADGTTPSTQVTSHDPSDPPPQYEPSHFFRGNGQTVETDAPVMVNMAQAQAVATETKVVPDKSETVEIDVTESTLPEYAPRGN